MDLAPRPTIFHTFLLMATVGVVYWWLHVPSLQEYSLQAFAGATLFYFIVKQRSNSKIWHLTPSQLSWEMTLATFAILMVVGATGGVTSTLFPLIYVHLFFLVFATPVGTSLVMTGLLLLFFYGLDPSSIQTHVAGLISLPLMVVFFLFAKLQFDEVNRKEIMLEEEEAVLDIVEDQELKLEEFVGTFLPDKIEHLKRLSEFAQDNKKAILGQLTLIELEIEKTLKRVRGD